MKRRFLAKKLPRRGRNNKVVNTPNKGDIYISKSGLRLYTVSKVSGSRLKSKLVHLIDMNPSLLLPSKVEERLSDFEKNYILLSDDNKESQGSSEQEVFSVRVGRWYYEKARPHRYHIVVGSSDDQRSILLSNASFKSQSQKKIGIMQLVNQYEPVPSKGFLPVLPVSSRWVWYSSFCATDNSYLSKSVYLIYDYGNKVAISSKKNSYLVDIVDKSEFLLYYIRVD